MEYEIPKKPDLKYADKTSQMVSWRLPKKLLERLRKEASTKNYNLTELVVMVLDQYSQYSDKNKK